MTAADLPVRINTRHLDAEGRAHRCVARIAVVSSSQRVIYYPVPVRCRCALLDRQALSASLDVGANGCENASIAGRATGVLPLLRSKRTIRPPTAAFGTGSPQDPHKPSITSVRSQVSSQALHSLLDKLSFRFYFRKVIDSNSLAIDFTNLASFDDGKSDTDTLSISVISR